MKKVFCFLAMSLLAGCYNAGYHKDQVANGGTDQLTVGKVQREIKVGMSSADVVQSLGSPNIVTTESDGSETWVYDKISTEAAVSSSGIGGGLLGGGAGNSAAGGGLFSGSYSSGAYSKNQKTLTIVVKFNKQDKVRDIAYHTSSF